MKNSTPLVSVIVLTYNQEHTIARTLESILVQKTNFPFEIIIGEDASPSDNTRQVCEHYATQYPDIIRLVPQTANKGLLRNYRDCTKECHGKYIATCAGDDWWHNPNKLQIQINALEQNSAFVLSYGSILVFNMATETTTTQIAQQPPQNLKLNIFNHNFISALTVCYRADILLHIDFDEFIREDFLMEDYPMWIIMAQYGEFHYVAEPIATYTLAEESACNTNNYEKAVRFNKSINKLRLHYALKFNHPIIERIKHDTISSEFVVALKFNEQQEAVKALNKLRDERLATTKDTIKNILCHTKFGFKILRKKIIGIQ